MIAAEFAKKHGVSRKTATIWKQKGILAFKADGTVDEGQSDLNLLSMHRDKRAVIIPPVTKVVTRYLSAGNEVSNDGTMSDDEGFKVEHAELQRQLTAAKVKIANNEAKAAQFETDLREGRLLNADEVKRHDSVIGLALRNKLLSIPSEHAIKIASLKSPAEVADVLRKAIKNALTEFIGEYEIEESAG